jgi:thiosulfate/3-mercaptopyruvate sulfurtransferase
MSYANPDVLVSTNWVKENLKTPNVRIVEVNVDPKVYDAGHIPGAASLNWVTQLQDQTNRDIVSAAGFERLLSDAGIKPSDTVILYGDNNNWFAAYGYWLFKIYGHQDVRLMNGGRAKWLAEDDKPLATDKPNFAPSHYKVNGFNAGMRAKVPEVLEAVATKRTNLVDVRSVDEFTGKIIAPPGMTETAQRAGHVPGARNIPWAQTVNQDGTFKAADELRDLYGKAGVDFAKPAIAYCRIGERSSHTWFVLRELLGVKDVKNYDGSWTEYGNLIGAPIEKGA